MSLRTSFYSSPFLPAVLFAELGAVNSDVFKLYFLEIELELRFFFELLCSSRTDWLIKFRVTLKLLGLSVAAEIVWPQKLNLSGSGQIKA